MEKIKANIKKLSKDEVPLVLICCGSFSPITYLHLRIFEMAKDYFKHYTNYRVIGGILSPVSDAYAKPSLITSSHRIEMCRLACQDSDFISVDPWEASQPDWTPTLQVLDHFNKEIEGCRIMLIAGSDLVEGFKNESVWSPEGVKGIINYGLVIIERSESSMKFDQENVFVIPQFIPCDISSSKLRFLLKEGLSIKYLTSDKVINYIKTNKLYQ